MTGTVGRTDIYGQLTSGGATAYEPFSVINPNGSAVAPPATQDASGGGGASDNQPAIGLLGIIAAVVALRLAIHAFGDRA